MRAVIVLISFVGVLLGARIGWQIGLLIGLGLLSVPGVSPIAGVGITATTWWFAGGGVLIGGLLGGAVCFLIARLLERLVVAQR